MARIISLGCDVAEVYRRYSNVHSTLFGAKSYRFVIDALIRKEGYVYVDCERNLEELLDRLAGLEADIEGSGEKGFSSRAAFDLRKALLEYTRSLHAVMVGLKGICHRLVKDEKGYRDASTISHSHFNRDKVDYERSIQQLERMGTRLNKLFSSYRY